MSKKAKHRDNAEPANDNPARYALLTKTNRLLIVLQPTAKELRRREKRGWQITCSFEKDTKTGKHLHDAVRAALVEMESCPGAKEPGHKKNKPKKFLLFTSHCLLVLFYYRRNLEERVDPRGRVGDRFFCCKRRPYSIVPHDAGDRHRSDAQDASSPRQ